MQSLDAVLQRALVARADLVVRAQLPLALGVDSEPEPDVAVVPAGDYAKAHPTTALLVIEVAQDSAVKDRQWKARIYGRAGIPEYRVVDLKQRVVDVHRGPHAEGYADVTRHAEQAVLRPVSITGVEIAIAAALPAP